MNFKELAASWEIDREKWRADDKQSQSIQMTQPFKQEPAFRSPYTNSVEMMPPPNSTSNPCTVTEYSDPYNQNTITQVEEILQMVKGPYPSFDKRIKLADLIEIASDYWEMMKE